MDTKWKKSKIAISFMAFAVGISLVIGSLTSAVQLLMRTDGGAFGNGSDYQQNPSFRYYISNRLEDLLGIATGGKSWKNYGTAEGDYCYNGEDWYWYNFDEDTGSGMTLDQYMDRKAQNKNIRYAVVKSGNLLYSNIDGMEDQTGKPWNGADFYEKLSAREYNFALWFNRAGDGKVEITKDGKAEDVYGDGVYTDESRWYVPGYTNFLVDDAADDVVIFLAAAREPKLYVVGDYAGGGTIQYGEGLYYMQKNFLDDQRQLRTDWILLGVGAVLLVLAWLQRDGKRQGDAAVARFLSKIWLELKILLGLGVLAVLWHGVAGDNLTEVGDLVRMAIYEQAGGAYLDDVMYYLGRPLLCGSGLVVLFWVVYLAALDGRRNRGRQKKLLFGQFATRNLKYVVQKNLVKRYRMLLGASVLALALGALTLAAIQRSAWEYGIEMSSALAVMMALVMVLLLVCVVAGFGNVRKNRQFAVDVGALADQIAAVREGNLTEGLELPADRELKAAADNLNEIQRGLEAALHEQMKSERMKVDLLTNVSHDIKTPLTSIVSYVDLLKQEEELPPHVREFIEILGEKSERLKTIVQDVFEVSKATSGQLPVNLEILDLGKLLRQTLADMNSQIEESGLVLRTSVPAAPVYIRADGQRLYRVFQNLLQNTLKYSMEGTRIFLMVKEDGGPGAAVGNMAAGIGAAGTGTDRNAGNAKSAGATAAGTGGPGRVSVYIKNTSAVELEEGVDFTERFVRGDASRTDGGSGLGLSIARSFTEACGGSFHTEIDADLFTAVVSFPVVQSDASVNVNTDANADVDAGNRDSGTGDWE